MSKFEESVKKYRVKAKFKLEAIDPEAIPFAKGSEDDQRSRLDALALELDALQDTLHANGSRKLLLVLQGMDTSGKDGTVRWVFSRTSPLGVRVASFKAPTEEERARDYLWRCHAVVPRTGELMVWNRSHYEDVLVPVVNRWIDKAEADRRYRQINDFEALLSDSGTVILKCMLHINPEEQRKRLQARVDDPSKHWKFSLGDLEVRKQWDLYMKAYEKALRATSTKIAPWYVIPANDKLHRNLMIAELIVRTLKDLKLKPPRANPEFNGLIID
jgi:PPK2 family polyphosphate:nucleotide phosphotransferase